MTTYAGGCQCGAVRYSVEMDEIAQGITCNCSRCQKLGSVLAFAPRDNFTLEKGADAVTEYTFNRHQIRHQFCSTCGIQSFSYGAMPDGTAMVAININCLDGVEPREIETVMYDGRAM
ncbi:GFA family protein [Pseudoruegeria sp. HB172150]|uniref:GFA family protein n=1 Tax=Pseudoruegeria sp. HB172150 TaxID=2721164 RepID=UPI00155476E3|nr:GFA family protein [Pseudoruegeria sp. HB172150]